MMIHMQPSPLHPIPLAHLSKKRMRLPRKIARHRRESRLQSPQLAQIHGKLHRLGSKFHLIDFRHRRRPSRPHQWRVQRHPFHHLANPHRLSRQLSISHHSAKRITQVTDRLMRVHLSPLPRTVRPQISQTRQNHLSIRRNAKTSLLHRRSPPSILFNNLPALDPLSARPPAALLLL